VWSVLGKEVEGKSCWDDAVSLCKDDCKETLNHNLLSRNPRPDFKSVPWAPTVQPPEVCL
jgi:hypothetical protein